METKKIQLDNVNIAIGVVIILVVYGHLLLNVRDSDWFVCSRKLTSSLLMISVVYIHKFIYRKIICKIPIFN
jgi:hypothetical protein